MFFLRTKAEVRLKQSFFSENSGQSLVAELGTNASMQTLRSRFSFGRPTNGE